MNKRDLAIGGIAALILVGVGANLGEPETAALPSPTVTASPTIAPTVLVTERPTERPTVAPTADGRYAEWWSHTADAATEFSVYAGQLADEWDPANVYAAMDSIFEWSDWINDEIAWQQANYASYDDCWEDAQDRWVGTEGVLFVVWAALIDLARAVTTGSGDYQSAIDGLTEGANLLDEMTADLGVLLADCS